MRRPCHGLTESYTVDAGYHAGIYFQALDSCADVKSSCSKRYMYDVCVNVYTASLGFVGVPLSTVRDIWPIVNTALTYYYYYYANESDDCQ